MSIIAFDGFDLYGNVNDLTQGRWNFFTLMPSTDYLQLISPGRYGGQAIRLFATPIPSANILKVLLNKHSVISFGASVRRNTSLSSGFIQVLNLTGPGAVLGAGWSAAQFTIRIGNDGSVALLIGGEGGPATAMSGPDTVLFNEWTFIEAQVAIGHPGTYRVQVNGRMVLSGTGITQGSNVNYADGFMLGITGSSLFDTHVEQFDFDDVYIGNTCDIPPNNTFLNEWMVEPRYMAGDTAEKGFIPIPSSPSNYPRVSEATEDGDATYISTTQNATDLYIMPQWFNGPTNVYAVNFVTYAKKIQAGGSWFQHIVQSEWNQFNSQAYAPGIQYHHYVDMLPTDPNTGFQWTAEAVNAMKVGISAYESDVVPPVPVQQQGIIPQPLVMP